MLILYNRILRYQQISFIDQKQFSVCIGVINGKLSNSTYLQQVFVFDCSDIQLFRSQLDVLRFYRNNSSLTKCPGALRPLAAQ